MSLAAHWQMPRRYAAAPHDLLHYPHFDLPYLAAGPVVATLHDLKYIAHPEFFAQQGWAGKARRLLMLALMRNTVKKARRVITVSHSTRLDAIRYLDAPPQKLRVAPEGVERRYFTPLPPEQITALRRKYGLLAPYVLFLGERRPHKNITGLLRAFAQLKRMHSAPLQLAIAGARYADYQEPERLAEDLGLQQAVVFLDAPPDSDLPALYQGASAFALLSRFEGFGLPVIEAMACGTPVVVSNVTSLPEVTGEADLQVSPDDPQAAAQALLSLLPGGEQREACIEQGRRRAEQFTWQRCAVQTLEVYREAIQP
jgi:glycosyltransferase involved in cell wall biosynthesis